MKSVPSSRFTRQTTSFILPFFTSRRGDWKMDAWPSSPVPCSPSAAPPGSFFSSTVASSSFVTLASSGLASAPSFSFSSFVGWRSVWKNKSLCQPIITYLPVLSTCRFQENNTAFEKYWERLSQPDGPSQTPQKWNFSYISALSYSGRSCWLNYQNVDVTGWVWVTSCDHWLEWFVHLHLFVHVFCSLSLLADPVTLYFLPVIWYQLWQQCGVTPSVRRPAQPTVIS